MEQFFVKMDSLLSVNNSIDIRITKTKDKLIVMIIPCIPKEAESVVIPPLLMNGTPAELENDFWNTMANPIAEINSALNNMDFFKKQLDSAVSVIKTNAEKKAKEAKTSGTSKTPAKPNKYSKPTPKEEEKDECPNCKGEGSIDNPNYDSNDEDSEETIDCAVCDGTGKVEKTSTNANGQKVVAATPVKEEVPQMDMFNME